MGWDFDFGALFQFWRVEVALVVALAFAVFAAVFAQMYLSRLMKMVDDLLLFEKRCHADLLQLYDTFTAEPGLSEQAQNMLATFMRRFNEEYSYEYSYFDAIHRRRGTLSRLRLIAHTSNVLTEYFKNRKSYER